MKAFTNLEQSKKLAEILPLKSADQTWVRIAIAGANLDVPEELQYRHNGDMPFELFSGIGVPCWSLATLIDVLPSDWWGHNEHYFLEISKNGDNSKPNKVCYYRFRKEIDGANYCRIPHISHSSENLIDACVNMIITLHEHKLLNK